MLKDIIEARPAADYQLHLRFEDGVEGTIDLAKVIPFEGVFAPLQDRVFFEQVRVNSELGTIVWPNGADLDPDVLYAQVSGKPIAVIPRQTTTH